MGRVPRLCLVLHDQSIGTWKTLAIATAIALCYGRQLVNQVQEIEPYLLPGELPNHATARRLVSLPHLGKSPHIDKTFPKAASKSHLLPFSTAPSSLNEARLPCRFHFRRVQFLHVDSEPILNVLQSRLTQRLVDEARGIRPLEMKD